MQVGSWEPQRCVHSIGPGIILPRSLIFSNFVAFVSYKEEIGKSSALGGSNFTSWSRRETVVAVTLGQHA